jgi:hypothetical protein
MHQANNGQKRQGRRLIMQHAGRWTGKAGDGSFSMSADVQRQDRRKIVQHALRCTKARQEMDHAACWQMDRGRAADGSYSMPADGQGQGSRWIIQHAGR